MSNLKAAVIGTGFIGPVHVEGLRRAGVSVVGILGSDAEKSTRAAERLSLPIGYQSLDSLLADDSVDVVHITSPNRFHFEQTQAVLEAGKHVLCEKPLAMNSEQSAKLVQLARSSGRAAGVNYNTRYYPLCQEAADRFRSGDAGRLFHAAGCYVQDWLFHPSDFNWRVSSEEGGPLRAVADIGTHWLDLVQFITGESIEQVCADLSTIYPRRTRPAGGVETFRRQRKESEDAATSDGEAIDINTEDYGCLMFRFQNNSPGVVWVSQVTAGRKNGLRWELAGSKYSLAWDSQRPNEIEVGHRDRPNEILLRDPALLGERAASASSYPGGHNEGFADTFKQLFLDFYESIESGRYQTEPTFPTFEDGHHEIQLCEAVLRSHQQRTWITVGENQS